MHASERAKPTSSRIRGPRHLLNDVRRLLKNLERADTRPDLTDDDHRWLRSVASDCVNRIRTGEAVLSGGTDPRPARRARKLSIVDVIDGGPLAPVPELLTRSRGTRG